MWISFGYNRAPAFCKYRGRMLGSLAIVDLKLSVRRLRIDWFSCAYLVENAFKGRAFLGMLQWSGFLHILPLEQGAEHKSEPHKPPQIHARYCASATWNAGLPLDPVVCKTTECSTLAFLLKRCGEDKALSHGRRVHAHISSYRYDHVVFLGNSLIEMYGNCGRTEDARAVFDKSPRVNLYSWNILMNSYVKNGHSEEALTLFHQLQFLDFKPDAYTFVCALNVCANPASLKEGRKIHAAIVESRYVGQVILGTALVSMYGKCGNLCDAISTFSEMPDRNVPSWNAMIAVCSQNGHNNEALYYFHKMQVDGFKPNPHTFVCALNACSSLASLKEGEEIHAAMIKSEFIAEAVVGTALVNMYSKCGRLSNAKKVFLSISNRDVASWNAMIAACAMNEHGEDALDLYHEMQHKGFKPDLVTYICALDACADLAALQMGQEIHVAIAARGYHGEVLGTALINMYGKCGSLCDARKVFYQISRLDVVSWSAMIAVCAQNGHEEEALDLFHQMQLDFTKPDGKTFLSILTACSHAGHIDYGRFYFLSMSEVYGLNQSAAHLVCMVDLLGRAGHLDDAEHMITYMPCEKNSTVWLCLLGACRIHGDVNRGIHVARQVFKLDPNNTAAYVILFNIYASAQ